MSLNDNHEPLFLSGTNLSGTRHVDARRRYVLTSADDFNAIDEKAPEPE